MSEAFPLYLLDRRLFTEVVLASPSTPNPPASPTTRSPLLNPVDNSHPWSTELSIMTPTEAVAAAADEVVRYFSAPGFVLPINDGSPKCAPLDEREMMFLGGNSPVSTTDGVADSSFVKAPGSAEEAIPRLERCIVWRRTLQLDDIDMHSQGCGEECRLGKKVLQGFSPSGNPVLYYFPNRNHVPPEERKVAHMVYIVERAMDLMTDGVTKLTLIVAFGEKQAGAQASPISHARDLITILSDFYPELLGTAVLYDMPWVARGFINCLWPFIDPATREKIRVCSASESIADQDVPRCTLLRECGGDFDCPYRHEAYWPTLLDVCRKRREEYLKRWRALGPAVGHEERLFKISSATFNPDALRPVCPTSSPTLKPNHKPQRRRSPSPLPRAFRRFRFSGGTAEALGLKSPS